VSRFSSTNAPTGALTRALIGVAAIGPLALASGCRGQQSSHPPIRVFDDMDEQQKYHPQGESKFFADGRAMRPIVKNTIAQGELGDDTEFSQGAFSDGSFVQKVPLPVDEAFLRRGQERFNIYCAPCHDQSGSGRGIVVQRGFHIPVDLSSNHTREIRDGEVFSYITNGVRNMPAYKLQIPERDRWAIVAWVRVLQRSQSASPKDVPPGTKILDEGATAEGVQ
jgi:mono/diheme cytochrome c family protein